MSESLQFADVHTALGLSVARLHGVVRAFGAAELDTPAYPSEWSVADVLSHLGSGAEIALRWLDDALTGRTTPDDYASTVWDTWNAKSPREKADDFLVRDQAFMERLASLTEDERSSSSFPLGPLTLDLGGFIGLRLNEHVLHTWDIEVAFDPVAQLSPETVAVVIDNLELIGRFTAKPAGDHGIITVLTHTPPRGFVIELRPDAVAFTATSAPASADVTLPAEAFIRLVYGRVDPDHSSNVDGDRAALTQLRRVFPGP
jgi:uncharacterized protein (TIGR03083 family)